MEWTLRNWPILLFLLVVPILGQRFSPPNQPGQPQPQPPTIPPQAGGRPVSTNNSPNNATLPGFGAGLNNPNTPMTSSPSDRPNDGLAGVKDEKIKRILLELSSIQSPSQLGETLARVAQLIGPLFYSNFDLRKDQLALQGRNASGFSQRLLSAFTEIQGEEVKALMLERKVDMLNSLSFGVLPLSMQYALQDDVLGNVTGNKLAALIKVNPTDTALAYKSAAALQDRPDQQVEFLQSLGSKVSADVERIIMRQILEWWGDPNLWKDRELSLLTSAGDPLLAYVPSSKLETLDDELADRFITILGQSTDLAKSWWLKPKVLRKSWFELAKGARFFGAVSEWSFRRMQKSSFLLSGASPEDLESIPSIPEIKGLVIANRYDELQARVVFDAFYRTGPLSQEDLQEFQMHVLSLTPQQIQRFDLADSFSTLDDMMTQLELQPEVTNLPTLLQISYYMWPLVNSTNGLTISPPSQWQKRELSQLGKLFFLLPKSTIFQIPPELINWDSTVLQSIRSSHLSTFEIWHLTSVILSTIDDRFKPDYVLMLPTPFHKGIPAQNISQVLLGSPLVRPEIIRTLIEESSGMLSSQQAVVVQRLRMRLGESSIIRSILSSERPEELFHFFSPRVISKNIGTIIKTIMEMPETGRFGITSVQAKLLPTTLLSLWLTWVRETSQLPRWSAEDLLGRSPIGSANEVDLAILGLNCREVDLVDPLEIIPVISFYRQELYNLRRYKPDLTFRLNLRPCVLSKVLEYLRIKSMLNGTQSDSHILSNLNYGEISGVGGEILSIIPPEVLGVIPIDTRLEILEEIGRTDMMDLFSMVSLTNLQWFANTLLRDIHGSSDQVLTLDSDSIQRMGSLLFYASEMVSGNWSKRILEDTLESKTTVGGKTCCMPAALRSKWVQLLLDAYGSDPAAWSEYNIASMGDLLIVLSEEQLQRISLEAMGNAISPILKQSGFDKQLKVPGKWKNMPFVSVCVDALGKEGSAYFTAYKALMRRIFQAAQWSVNTVKTTNELIKEGVGRSGRIPRWAEFNRRPRQTPVPTNQGSSQSAPLPQSLPNQQSTPLNAQSIPVSGSQGQQGQPMPNPTSNSQGTPQSGPQPLPPGMQQSPFKMRPMIMLPMMPMPNSMSAPNVQPGNQGQIPTQSGSQPQQQPGTQVPGGQPADPRLQQQGPTGAQQQDQGQFFIPRATLGDAPAPPNVPGQGQQTPAGQGQPQIPPGQGQQIPSGQGQQFPSGQGQQIPPGQGQVNPQQQFQQQQPGAQRPLQNSAAFPLPDPSQGQVPQPNQQTGTTDSADPSSASGIVTDQTVQGTSHDQGTGHDSTKSDTATVEKPRDLSFDAVLQKPEEDLEITCLGIQAAGSAAIGLKMDDINKLSLADLFDCVETFGKIEWDDDMNAQLLQLIKEKLLLSPSVIDTKVLIEMGGLVRAFTISIPETSDNSTSSTDATGSTVTVADASNIDLTLTGSWDMLSILGKRISNPEVLKALAQKFNADNRIFPGFAQGIARPDNLRIAVLSLGNMICGLGPKIVNSIFESDGTLYTDVCRTLGDLEGCSADVLSTLATHAVRPSNFGPPKNWNQEDVHALGVVFAGLKPDAIADIPPIAMEGLRPLAIKSLPPSSFQAFTEDQLSHFSYTAAVAASRDQINALASNQLDALNNVLKIQNGEFEIALAFLPTGAEVDPALDDGNDNANDTLAGSDGIELNPRSQNEDPSSEFDPANIKDDMIGNSAEKGKAVPDNEIAPDSESEVMNAPKSSSALSVHLESMSIFILSLSVSIMFSLT